MSFLPPLVTTLPPLTSAPTPQKIKGFEPSISPSPSTSTIASSPPAPYNDAHAPSTAEGNVPPSIQPSPSQSKTTPAIRPPVSTPIAPGNMTEKFLFMGGGTFLLIIIQIQLF